jgi:hypothetical protein
MGLPDANNRGRCAEVNPIRKSCARATLIRQTLVKRVSRQADHIATPCTNWATFAIIAASAHT